MVAPNERNPAAGPGFEMPLEIHDSPKAYRSWPEQGTIRRQILDALRSGRRLTSRVAWAEFGGSRLAADIHELRRCGWPIQSEEIRVPGRAGRIARVASYALAEGGE